MSSPSSSPDADTAAVHLHRTTTSLFRPPTPSPPRAPKRRPLPRFLGDDSPPAPDLLFGDLDSFPSDAAFRARISTDITGTNRDGYANGYGNGNGNGTGTGAGEGEGEMEVDKIVGLGEEGDQVDGVKVRKKRVVARLDEERVLGESGFQRLAERVGGFRVGRKGDEIKDLKRVMVLYQLWAHQMYPKTNLRDSLSTIERLGHKRSVQRGVRELREKSKPGKKGGMALDGEEEGGFMEGGEERGGEAAPERVEEKEKEKQKEKEGSAAEFDDLFADEDEEAMLAELDAAEARGGVTKLEPKAGASTQIQLDENDDDDDEDAEALLRSMDFM